MEQKYNVFACEFMCTENRVIRMLINKLGGLTAPCNDLIGVYVRNVYSNICIVLRDCIWYIECAAVYVFLLRVDVLDSPGNCNCKYTYLQL